LAANLLKLKQQKVLAWSLTISWNGRTTLTASAKKFQAE
jgi:hypothetical protein